MKQQSICQPWRTPATFASQKVWRFVVPRDTQEKIKKMTTLGLEPRISRSVVGCLIQLGQAAMLLRRVSSAHKIRTTWLAFASLRKACHSFVLPPSFPWFACLQLVSVLGVSVAEFTMASSPLPSAAVPEALRSTCQLLDGLMSPVNTTRRNAEAVYATAAGNPQAVRTGLSPRVVACLCTSLPLRCLTGGWRAPGRSTAHGSPVPPCCVGGAPRIRCRAAAPHVRVHDQVVGEGGAGHPSPGYVASHCTMGSTSLIACVMAVKSALLQAVQTDASPMVVRRICHCIAELSATVLSNPGWPELMPCIFGLVQGADRARRASALFLFNKVAEYCGDVRATTVVRRSSMSPQRRRSPCAVCRLLAHSRASAFPG